MAINNNEIVDRDEKLRLLYETLDSGSSVLLAGPRRMGKTTLLKRLVSGVPSQYVGIYHDASSADNESDFFHKLNTSLAMRLKDVFNEKNIPYKWKQLNRKAYVGSEIDGHNVTIELLKELSVNHTVIVVIDEFSYALLRIYNQYGERASSAFLQSHRVVRQRLSDVSVSFVYSGSLDIYRAAKRMSSEHLINDLYVVRLYGLDASSIERVLDESAFEAELVIEPSIKDFIVKQLGAVSPYLLNLLIGGIVQWSSQSGTRHISKKNVIDAEDRIATDLEISRMLYLRKFELAYEEDADKLIATKILDALSAEENESGLSEIELETIAGSLEILPRLLQPLLEDGIIRRDYSENKYCFDSPIYKKMWRYAKNLNLPHHESKL